MTNIAVVGCGVWGRNLVRNFYHLGVLHTVCDLDDDHLKPIRENYPDVNIVKNIEEIFENDNIDAVVIATPSHTHYPLAKRAIEAEKHVYVEKPIATKATEALELDELSKKYGVVLMVGHLLLYHPVVNRLRSIIKDGILGEIKYVQSDRLNVNFFKNDRSVMWDLAPHDVSMISYVLDKKPLSVKSAIGCACEKENVMDITHISINYEDDVVAHISNSWVTPIKKVTLMVRGAKATAMLDDSQLSKKLHIYDNFSTDREATDYPDYIDIEPLKLECQHFISCIETRKKSRSDGENGYEVVKILEEAEQVMHKDDLSTLDKLKFLSSRVKR